MNIKIPKKSFYGLKLLTSFQSTIAGYFLLVFYIVFINSIGENKHFILASNLFILILNSSLLVLILNSILQNQRKISICILVNMPLLVFIPVSLRDIFLAIKSITS